MKGSYQDEEALVGELLVLGDGGEHGQHQAAEHQQKTETHTHRNKNTLHSSLMGRIKLIKLRFVDPLRKVQTRRKRFVDP